MKKFLLFTLTICSLLFNAQINFHDTKGAIDVDAGGQLNYTLPIALPPGIKSVAPQINLSYKSGSGNGIAGYGWSISGITSISRVGKNIEKDGQVTGVNLDYTDYYQFNGQRLILKSGTYGHDGAEYTTEKFSNVKIKSVGQATLGLSLIESPAYWEVTFEDGSMAWYGNYELNFNNNARTPIEYNIVKWKDVQGNYITYNYSQSYNVAAISSIQWGGNELLGKAHFNQIAFEYQNKGNYDDAYIKGKLFKQLWILKRIYVRSNGKQFKKYELDYNYDFINNDITQTVHYFFVKSIQEFNAQNEPANKVLFKDKSLVTKVTEKPFVNFENIITTGDYNGDGLIDFVVKQPSQNGNPEGYYLYFDAINSNNSFVYLGATNVFQDNDIITCNIVPSDNFIKPKQGLVFIKKNSVYDTPPITGNVELKYYNIKSDNTVLNTFNSPLILEYSKTLLASEYEYANGTYPTPTPPPNAVQSAKKSLVSTIKEVDIDGDGLSEIIMSVNDYKYYKTIFPGTEDENGVPKSRWHANLLGVRYIVIDKQVLLSNSFHVIPSVINKNILGKTSIMDFDNDGKQDIMFIEPNVGNVNVSFYTKEIINQNVSQKTISVQSNKISQYVITKTNNNYNISLKKEHNVKGMDNYIVYADLNGDKNIEILAPLEKGDHYSTDDMGWSINLNNGNDLVESFQGLFLFRDQTLPSGSFEKHYPTALDIDNDGKSELVNFLNYYSAGNNQSYVRLFAFREFVYTPDHPQFKWHYTYTPLYQSNFEAQSLYPIYGDFRINNSNSKILMITNSNNNANRKIISFQNYNLNVDKNITSILQGGINTTISYKELDPLTSGNIYATVKNEQYPFVEIQRQVQSFVIDQLQQTNGQKILKQDFKYRGLTTNLHGRGMVGFRQTARSSWYANGYENTKIWSGAEIDVLNYGLPIKEWTIKTNDENLIFPQDISVNNQQLLSVKLTNYNIQQLANGVSAIVPQIITEKDFLKNITSVSTVAYDNYYLPTNTETKINNNFAKKITTMHYIHNANGTGNNYFIGRPDWKEESVFAYNNIAKSKTTYIYDNNLLKTTTNYNKDNTGWIKDTFTYDGFGNITKKITTNSVDNQSASTTDTYEPLGRFVIKKTDNLGLENNFTYNDLGQVLVQADAFGNTQTNTYDNWGKLMTSNSSLAGIINYEYSRYFVPNPAIGMSVPAGTVVKENAPNGDQKIVLTNTLGQNYKTITKSSNQNKLIISETAFDTLGRKIGNREPYISQTYNADSPVINGYDWNTISYDDTVYPPTAIAEAAYGGKKIKTVTNGNTVSVEELNGYGRITTKTTDALGNVVSSTDKGGTITFTYNANGQNLTSSFEGNVVNNEYDEWGRKTLFRDPSNGKYTYSYDGFGKTKEIKSPKGLKKYFYNAQGLLTDVNETATDGSTEKKLTIEYNNKWLPVTKKGISKGKDFLHKYSYDANGRLNGEGEIFENRIFATDNITFDNLGRVQSYQKSIISNGNTTKVDIQNQYNTWNGALNKVIDSQANKTLWSFGDVNAKEQVTMAQLGNTKINHLYDVYGFLELSSVNKLPGTNYNPANNILQLSYNFDAIKNELNARSSIIDGNTIAENFEYDDNNRLTNWTNPVTGQMSNNEYDNKGRILYNDQIGHLDYNGISNYQATNLKLNTEGQENYKINGQSKLIQKIAYNENNDPVQIDGTENDYNFGYGLTNARQIMHYGGNFEDTTDKALFTKYYNEDASFEVVRNNQTGEEKHLIYIGGSPYEANIVYLKNFQEEEAKFVFLHKDYLGSILAITDEDGNRLEQRHYDAWGVLTHLKIGNEPVITEADKIATSQLLIDRGYTSHEHLLGVDLIHMNGRLYDPLLRRFLNADENIQDPYNTQNYNKYGYVLNNPLMYNDPSGEFFVAGFFLSWIAPIIWGAIVGAAVGAGLYIVQGLITNNWSWNGFAKSIIMGAVTGGVAGGLGQIFTASGFWGTVGNGALSGAGTGGVTSLINGDNFLEGVLKGAVIGGIVGGITYTIRYFNNSRTQELCKAEYDSYGIEDSGEALDPSMKTLRGMYHDAGWDEMNTGAKQFYVDHVSNGYTKSGNLYLNTKGEEVIAYTRRNFWDGNTSSISFSKHAFGSKIKLGFVMMHELGHSTLNLNAGLNNFLQVKTKSGFEPEMLPKAYGLDKISIEHGAIWGIEREFLKLNGYKELSGFFNLQNAAYFNTYFLKNQQYQHVFDAIKHLPVKFK